MLKRLEANELTQSEPNNVTGGTRSTRATGGKCGTSAEVVNRVDEKPLIVSSSTLPGNFFEEQALLAMCTLGNNSKIKITALLNTRATRYFFVDLSMVRCICDELLIEPIRLLKPKAI